MRIFFGYLPFAMWLVIVFVMMANNPSRGLAYLAGGIIGAVIVSAYHLRKRTR